MPGGNIISRLLVIFLCEKYDARSLATLGQLLARDTMPHILFAQLALAREEVCTNFTPPHRHKASRTNSVKKCEPRAFLFWRGLVVQIGLGIATPCRGFGLWPPDLAVGFARHLTHFPCQEGRKVTWHRHAFHQKPTRNRTRLHQIQTTEA